MDVNFTYEEITSDYQTISIQGQVTYRIIDYKTITHVIDFTVMEKGEKPVESVSKLQNRQHSMTWESDYLYFTVREPYPSRFTGAEWNDGKVVNGTGF